MATFQSTSTDVGDVFTGITEQDPGQGGPAPTYQRSKNGKAQNIISEIGRKTIKLSRNVLGNEAFLWALLTNRAVRFFGIGRHRSLLIGFSDTALIGHTRPEATGYRRDSLRLELRTEVVVRNTMSTALDVRPR